MNEAIWIAIFGFLGLVVVQWFLYRGQKATLKNNLDLAILQLKQKQEETHDLVNSRMTELLELTKKSSKAEGKAEEKAEGKEQVEEDVKGVKVEVQEVKVEVKEVKEEVKQVKEELKTGKTE